MAAPRRKSFTRPSRRWWTASLTALSTATCVLMVTGCASPTSLLQAFQRDPIPPNLTQPCPDLTPLPDGSGASVLRKLKDVSMEYYECKLRHEKLVEAVK